MYEELKKLDAEATPGPWRLFICDDGGEWTGWPLSIEAVNERDKTVVRTGGQWPYEWDASISQNEACANAALIVAMRNTLPELLAKAEAHDALVSALESINQYGTDTLSGNADGPSDVDWYRGGVEELVIRSGAAIAKLGGRDVG